ncbi:uncharacterized protein TRIADDRAFT_13686, partial [Trichoplax adhaerens]
LHRSLIDALRKRLTEEVEKSNPEKLQQLLAVTFPSIHIKSIRPVCIEIMKRLPSLPQNYLTLLEDNQDLLQILPIEVRRQVWQNNLKLFALEINPLIDTYLRSTEDFMFSLNFDKQQHFFNKAPRKRRQNEVLQKIVELIGRSVKLYNTTLQILRTLYFRNAIEHYCTLRLEILMKLHDNDVREILSLDPCYKFVWCLDACLRDGLVDSKRCNELIALMEEATKESGKQILGDFAIILADPFVIHALTGTIFRSIQLLYDQELLPRDVPLLHSLLRLLSLGLNASQMIHRQDFAEIDIDNVIVLRFIPTIMLLIHSLKNNGICPPNIDLDFFSSYIHENPIARRIACELILHLCNKHNLSDLSLLLPKVAPAFRTPDISDNIFLHLFIYQLVISFLEEHGNDEFYQTVFEEFFLQCENVDCTKHMLRLLWFNYRRMASSNVSII